MAPKFTDILIGDERGSLFETSKNHGKLKTIEGLYS